LTFRDITVLNCFDFMSDHRFVRARLDARRPAYRNGQPGRTRIAHDVYRAALATTHQRPTTTITAAYDDIVSRIATAREAATVPLPRRQVISDRTRDLLRARRTVQGDPNRLAEFTRVSKEARTNLKNDIRTFQDTVLENAARYGRSYRTFERATTAKPTGFISLVDAAGRHYKTQFEMEVHVSQYYNALYRNPGRPDVAVPQSDDACPEFLQAEVEFAIRQSTSGTSPGLDRITGELLKSSTILAPELTALFNDMLQTKEIPERLADSNIKLLFKKGDHKDIGNYRPIALLSSIYKTLMRLLYMRISPTLQASLDTCQAGFRRGYSTTQQIFVVTQILERSREYPMNTFMAFVDFKKAFDSPYHDVIWKTMSEYGIHSDLTTLFKALYENTTSIVNVNHTKCLIDVRRGVKQGCPHSPPIFNLVLDAAMIRINWDEYGIPIDGRTLSWSAYADDLVLFATSTPKLTQMLNDLVRICSDVGLEINFKKTVYMTNIATRRPIVLDNGKSIAPVDKFNYLGYHVSFNVDREAPQRQRISSGWFAFKKFKTYLCNRRHSRHFRARIFNIAVLPAMTYGAELWTITEMGQSPIAVEHRRMARRMLGISILDLWTNDRIYHVSLLTPIAEVAVRRKWKFAKTLALLPPDRWPRRIAEWYPRNKKRAQGRPPLRWSDELRNELGVNWLRMFSDNNPQVNHSCDRRVFSVL
jgi:hypothetical protein